MRCTVLGLCEKERCYSESYLIGSVRTGTGIQGFLGAVCIEGLGFDLDIGFNRLAIQIILDGVGGFLTEDRVVLDDVGKIAVDQRLQSGLGAIDGDDLDLALQTSGINGLCRAETHLIVLGRRAGR